METGEYAMEPAPENDHEEDKEHTDNLPLTIPGGTIYSYNLDNNKTPGGIKVRWKIRVVTGPEAARYDARQAEAIMEALRWTARHQRQLRAARPGL
jgi:hypothetical protein